MTDDIVTRLRVLSHHAKKLAENESLHDLHFDALTRCEDLTLLAADEIQRLRELSGDAGKLRKERDEARQEICRNEADDISMELGGAAIFAASVAKRRGWDCFKEER